MLRDGGRIQPPSARQGCPRGYPFAPRRPTLLTQVTKGLCRKSSRSSETVTSMSPELGRRREAAGAGPAHTGDKGAEPMARRPAARRALPTGQTMRGSSLPRPAPGAHAGPLAAIPPPNGNRPVFPRRARSAAAVGVLQAKASHGRREQGALSLHGECPGAQTKGAELPQDSSEQPHTHSAPAVLVPAAGRARAPAIRPGRWRRRDGQRPLPMGGAEGPGSGQWTARRAAPGAGRGVGSWHRPHAAVRAAAASARPAGAALRLRLRFVPAVTAVMRGRARKLAREAAPGAAVPAGSRLAPRPPLGTVPAPSGSARVRSLCFKKHEIPHKLLRGAPRRAT